MNPLISILTPTYNHERFINKCIESVLDQTYQNWEMIIIDDGSTDNTGNIISKYNDKRIKYVKQENIGIWRLKETYNKALSLSKGDLIAILEGDDYWPSYKLEEQIKVFKNHDVILECGNGQIVNNKNEFENVFHKSESIPKILPTYTALDKLLIKNFIPACTVLCKKKALLSIGGFHQPSYFPSVDYPTWIQLSKLGKFYYEDTIMGYWRHHENQISSTREFEMIKATYDYSAKFFNDLTIEEKKLLSINLDDIIRSKNITFAESNLRLGMKYLYKNEWENSRNYFETAMKGTNKFKLQAVFGIICSILKIDIASIIPLKLKSLIYQQMLDK